MILRVNWTVYILPTAHALPPKNIDEVFINST